MKRKYLICIGFFILISAVWIVMRSFHDQKTTEKKAIQDQADWLKQIKPGHQSFK